jgi:hypothetical protein
MSISMLSSGSQMINQSNRMVESAARDINENAQQDKVANSALLNSGQQLNQSQPVNSAPKQDTLKPQSDIDPLIKLQEASQYSRIGASVVQREQDTVGSLLDIHV